MGDARIFISIECKEKFGPGKNRDKGGIKRIGSVSLNGSAHLTKKFKTIPITVKRTTIWVRRKQKKGPCRAGKGRNRVSVITCTVYYSEHHDAVAGKKSRIVSFAVKIKGNSRREQVSKKKGMQSFHYRGKGEKTRPRYKN